MKQISLLRPIASSLCRSRLRGGDARSIVSKKLPAFSLTEVLIALAIIGIVGTAAMPKLLTMVGKAKSMEAQNQLEYVHTLEKNYFYMHSKYSTSFTDISFEQDKLTSEGGNAKYKIEITDAAATTFKATATAVEDFDGDGAFNVWQVDQDKNIKEVTPD